MIVQTRLLRTHLQSAKRRSTPHTHHSSPTAPVQPVLRHKRCASFMWTRKAFRCETWMCGLHCGCPGKSNKDYYVPLLAPSHCSTLNMQAWTGRVWGRSGTGQDAQAATVNELWWQCMVMKEVHASHRSCVRSALPWLMASHPALI